MDDPFTLITLAIGPGLVIGIISGLIRDAIEEREYERKIARRKAAGHRPLPDTRGYR